MISRGIRRLFKRLGWYFGFEAHDFDGLRLLIYVGAADICLHKAAAALTLIKDLDPRTYSLTLRLLTGGVAVTERASDLAWYDIERKSCCLGCDFVEAYEVEDIALAIVHELSHARLMNRGIGYDEGFRLRVEKVCLRIELAFARLLVLLQPDGRDFVAEVEQQLERISSDLYSDDQFRRKARRDQLIRLRELKAMQPPGILRRCAVLYLRRRWRQRPGR